MMKQIAATIFTAAIVTTFGATAARGDALADGYSKDKVKPAVPLQVRAFDLRDVRVLEGPFQHAQELDGKYILSLDPDRLLHTFRLNAKIPSSARPLTGWEEPNGELRGHFIGHYLSACAMMYASTGDPRYKDNALKVVKGLAEVQAKLGASGFLAAWPETFIDRVEARQRVWAPYYTLHKIYAGLEDVYDYCDDQQALDVAKKMGDWAIARNSKLTDPQMQRMLGEEHGGMNEALANLYALTAEEKYLGISLRFNHARFIDSLAKGVDNLDGNHANTQFPKFIGAARQYELTGKENLRDAATNFWNFVVHDRSYVIGGNSDSEQFSPKARLSTALGPSTTETCNTYNMLKLTRHMFALEPKAEYGDFYERGLFNQILGSQHPEDGADDVLLSAAIRFDQGFSGRRLFRLLRGNRDRKPREVRRQHLFPRRRKDTLRQSIHIFRTGLAERGRQTAAGNKLSRRAVHKALGDRCAGRRVDDAVPPSGVGGKGVRA